MFYSNKINESCSNNKNNKIISEKNHNIYN